jgi:hypothetical protein
MNEQKTIKYQAVGLKPQNMVETNSDNAAVHS